MIDSLAGCASHVHSGKLQAKISAERFQPGSIRCSENHPLPAKNVSAKPFLVRFEATLNTGRQLIEKRELRTLEENSQHGAALELRRFLRLTKRSWLLAFILLAPLGAQQLAHPRESLSGIVRTAAGRPVAKATVTAVGPDAREQRYASVTATDGRFTISGLVTGRYTLTVKAPGLPPTSPAAVDFTGAALELTISTQNRLAISSIPTDSQSSNVPVNTDTVSQGATKAASATGGEKLSSTAVSELPLNGRDFSTLLLLAAGTMTDINGATNFTQQFAINGQRGVEAAFAMNGADISDPEMGGSTFTNFNVDAIQDLQSSSGWMPASIGRGAAGFTNIVTRSGSSGFHGSFFEFLRNSALDARNYFDHPSIAEPGRIPPFRRNEFGFTNGGPVVLHHLYNGNGRTFYFGEYQGFRQVLGTTQVLAVPTAAERAGNDALTFPGGASDTLIVPVNPAIASILSRYPLPNNPTGAFGDRTYAAPSNVATNADQFSIRIDQKLGEKGQFLGRFTYDNLTGPTTNPDQTILDPSFGVQYVDRQRNVVFRYTRTVSPRFIWISSLSITRSTPSFPTPNHKDPGLKFTDGLFEGFNTGYLLRQTRRKQGSKVIHPFICIS